MAVTERVTVKINLTHNSLILNKDNNTSYFKWQTFVVDNSITNVFSKKIKINIP